MNNPLAQLRLHHIGCAVESIEGALKTYRDLLGFNKVSETYYLEDIGIKACFVELANGVHIEFIESYGGDSIINTYRKKGISYYHLGYLVKDVDKVVEELIKRDFKEASSVNSPAFGNRKCVFLYTPELQLIEVIESD